MAKPLDASWNNLPDAKIRMRDDGLKTIVDGLGPDGFCGGATPRVLFDEDGIYIEVLLNVGKYGNVVALPLEILIPIPAKLLVKKPAKEKKANAAKSTDSVSSPSAVVCVEPEASSDDAVGK